MRIGFIGFGKVNQRIYKLLKDFDFDFVTSIDERSLKTQQDIFNTTISLENSFAEVCYTSDVVISATSPKSALEIARRYGKLSQGVYLDLNNVSPQTMKDMDKYIDKLVDGAIIGNIENENPSVYLSGEFVDELSFLNEVFDIHRVSNNIGDAAMLKLIRSTYTKTLSATLIETFGLAEKYGLKKELLEILQITEGDEFIKKSESRVSNTLKASKRKTEELEEILEYFSDDDLTMVEAALKKISQ